MPQVPSIVNNWRFRVSQSVAGATPAAMRQELLLQIKFALLGLGSWTDDQNVASSIDTPWEVVSSSDSVTAGAADYWDTSTDLVWAAEGVAHSWIVLRNPDYFGAANPLYMLLNCNPGSTQNATLMVGFSRAGYTGGSITARPTATDEHIARPVAGTISTAGWQGDDGSTLSLSMRVHFLLTDDGRKFYVFFTRNSVCIAMWSLFDLEDDADGNWDEPYLFSIASEDFNAGSEVELLTIQHFYTDSESQWYGRDQGGVGNFTADVYVPFHGGAASDGTAYPGGALEGFGGFWIPFPIALGGIAPASTGPIAILPDAWWARIAEGTGSVMRDDDLEQGRFMQFGAIMVPWNDSTIVLG